MGRETSQHAPVEVRPTLVMKAAQYKQWRHSLFSYRPNITTIFDQAVVDLVETYKLVPKDREKELRFWLWGTVRSAYFEKKIRGEGRLTPTQEGTCRNKIAKAGDNLLRELCWLYNWDPADLVMPHLDDQMASPGVIDCFKLNEILFRAKEWRGEYTTKGHNAAKPALKLLGQHIRDFWVTNCLEDPETAPDITAGSPYVQFGKYIYFFVDEAADVPRVIQRLKAVEDDPGLAPLKKQAQKNNA